MDKLRDFQSQITALHVATGLCPKNTGRNVYTINSVADPSIYPTWSKNHSLQLSNLVESISNSRQDKSLFPQRQVGDLDQVVSSSSLPF